jgi:hypothetical protein
MISEKTRKDIFSSGCFRIAEQSKWKGLRDEETERGNEGVNDQEIRWQQERRKKIVSGDIFVILSNRKDIWNIE